MNRFHSRIHRRPDLREYLLHHIATLVGQADIQSFELVRQLEMIVVQKGVSPWFRKGSVQTIDNSKS